MNRYTLPSLKLLLPLTVVTVLLFTALPSGATDIVNRELAIDLLDRTGPTRFEGLWQFTDNGATVLIIRDSNPAHPDGEPPSYSVIMVQPVDGSGVKPGELIGQAWPTAKADYFDCRLKGTTDSKDRYHKFTAHLNDEGHMSFVKDKSGMSVSLWRWIPYLFRVTVVNRHTRDESLDGCIKLYPVEPSTFKSPRYL
ncbi:MAG: hypothetical protein K2J42_04935 [Muribaculaceae bacterium]|nr:hypothetical protein [Muribaculaceae bacterium]